MTVIARLNYTGMADGATLNGRALEDASGTPLPNTMGMFTGGTALLANGAGRAKGGNVASSSIFNLPGGRLFRGDFEPSGTPANIGFFFGFDNGIYPGPNGMGFILISNHTSLRLFTTNASAVRTDRATTTMTAPGIKFGWEFDARDPTAVTAKIINLADGTVRNTVTYNYGSLPASANAGFGFYQGGTTGTFGPLEIEDAPGNPAPILTSPTGTATGSQSASGTVTTDTANGMMYAAMSATDLTADAIIAAANSQAVTTTGVKSFTFTGAAQGAMNQKTQFVHVRSTGERSAVARSAAFNLDTPLPAPGGTSNTVMLGGRSVRIDYTPTGTVASATASLPVAAIPNGAVAEPPKAMALSGGVWSATFTPVEGDYGVPVVLASNFDNPSTSITGAQAFDIIALKGFDQDV